MLHVSATFSNKFKFFRYSALPPKNPCDNIKCGHGEKCVAEGCGAKCEPGIILLYNWNCRQAITILIKKHI